MSMSLLVFDIGGQGVKHAIWHESSLLDKGSFATPANWDSLKLAMKEVLVIAQEKHEITGVAISSPGSVDSQAGVIHGISAVQYLHEFEIVKAWQELFELPVSIENDANAAALAELDYGIAKDYKNVAFMIIGSGIGGAIAINGELVKGQHLFAGELGYMLLDHENTLSNLSSSLLQINRHNAAHPEQPIANGLELFSLAEVDDPAAKAMVNEIYDSLARGIYNLSLIIDPELVAIGGGISVRPEITRVLTERVSHLLDRQGAADIKPNIQVCQFFNDANLIGAAVHFERTFLS